MIRLGEQRIRRGTTCRLCHGSMPAGARLRGVKPPSWFAAAVLAASISSGFAVVWLHDTWADGTRSDTNLPEESAWYASAAASLTASPGAMTGQTGGSSSRTWWTYFTTNALGPIQLQPGDTLRITLAFTPQGVNLNNSSYALRIGVYDYSGGTRRTTDNNSPDGTGVTGYLLNANFGQTFGVNNPLQIRERTNVGSSDLMGSIGDYTTLAVGGGPSGSPGFSDGLLHWLIFSITREANALTLSFLFTNTSGWTVSVSATDTNNLTDRFDTFALRPANTTQTASSFVFTAFTVELLSASPVVPMITSQPRSQTVVAGQNVSFHVEAEGAPPLAYQWYFNTNTPIAGATHSLLSLTNVQSTDAGFYSVVVTNPAGGVTSDFAELTVTPPVAPMITRQPDSLIVPAGLNAQFVVTATGTPPLHYQWYFNNHTVLADATNAVLAFASVHPTNAGAYQVVVINSAGAATSAVATLTVDTTPVPPSFILHPVSLIALAGGSATFTAQAAGTSPIGYQWRKNGMAVPEASASTLHLPQVQLSDAGQYVCVATNSVGAATSAVATLTVTVALPDSAFDLQGFARGVTGGGVIAETDPNYRKVYSPEDLVTALASKTLKVIEIMNDLNLGWNEIPASARTGAFRAHAAPSLHPVLLTSGVTLVDIQDKNGLTIFSAHGATIRHAEFNVKRCTNVVIRNLKFDELWEWDEATKGDYDSKDWDFMTIDMNSDGIWVDHCDFTKAYDGVVDIKGGSRNITISWCRFLGDDGGPNSFVRQQINFLEQNPAAYPMYQFLRTRGFSVEDIIAVVRSQKKGHLVGATEFDAANARLSVTLHHNYYLNFQDRIPRLRGGNAHNFNLYVNNTEALAAKRLRNARVAAMSPADALKLSNGTYNFDVTLNGAISTEDGAVLVEKCHIADTLFPIRNNQTDPNNPSYTGKIRALDTIYVLDGVIFRGDSEAPGSPLAPVPAPPKPFSFNGFTTLPYAYTMDEPSQLTNLLLGPGRVGAGELTWAKTNWLRTTYPVSPPVIIGQPQDLLVNEGQTAVFAVTATGTALQYQWYFNTNTPLPGATENRLTLPHVQALEAGSYSVLVSNQVGSAQSSAARLTVNRHPAPGGWTAVTGQNVPLTIPLNRLLSVALDPDGDALAVTGVSASSTNQGSVLLTNHAVQYSPPADYTGPDQFSYTLADSRGGFAIGVVSLTVVPPSAVAISVIDPPTLSAGVLRVTFGGYPGLTYAVDRATDLSGPWELQYTNLIAGPEGRMALIVPHDPGEPARFYRVRYP